MKTLEYSRSNRLMQVLLVVAIAATLGFGIKFLYEAFRATKNTIEVVHNAVEQIVKDETATDVHGNSNESQKLQIVYEIYGLDASDKKFVLKYGVSGQKNYKRKWGNPRPKLQLKGIAKRPDCLHYMKIDYSMQQLKKLNNCM